MSVRLALDHVEVASDICSWCGRVAPQGFAETLVIPALSVKISQQRPAAAEGAHSRQWRGTSVAFLKLTVFPAYVHGSSFQIPTKI